MNKKIFVLLITILSSLTLLHYLGLKKKSETQFPNDDLPHDTKSMTEIKVLDSEIHLGELDLSEDARAIFKLANLGSNHLEISHVEISCDCTTSESYQNEVKPGDTLYLPVIYNKGIPGFFYQDVIVYGNFKESPLFLAFDGTLIRRSNNN